MLTAAGAGTEQPPADPDSAEGPGHGNQGPRPAWTHWGNTHCTLILVSIHCLGVLEQK